MKKLSEVIGMDGVDRTTRREVETYYKLVNEKEFEDDFNRFKNIKVLEIEEKPLKFSWIICKVKVERCGRSWVEYLCIRSYGARGSWGNEVVRSVDGYGYNIYCIDYDKEIRSFGYNSGNLDLLKDYCKLLKIIKEKEGVE